MMTYWFTLRKQAPKDVAHVFDETYLRRPYSLIAIYNSLTQDEESMMMTEPDRKALIEKSLKDLSPAHYAQF
jgi:hypothetical protein